MQRETQQFVSCWLWNKFSFHLMHVNLLTVIWADGSNVRDPNDGIIAELIQSVICTKSRSTFVRIFFLIQIQFSFQFVIFDGESFDLISIFHLIYDNEFFALPRTLISLRRLTVSCVNIVNTSYSIGGNIVIEFIGRNIVCFWCWRSFDMNSDRIFDFTSDTNEMNFFDFEWIRLNAIQAKIK